MSDPSGQTAMEMGAQIRRAREGAGMTIQELARLTHSNEEWVRAIERGERLAAIGGLQRVMRALGQPPLPWDWRPRAEEGLHREEKKLHEDLDDADLVDADLVDADLDDDDLDDDDLDDDDLDDEDEDDDFEDEEDRLEYELWQRNESRGINWLANRLLAVWDGLGLQEREQGSPAAAKKGLAVTSKETPGRQPQGKHTVGGIVLWVVSAIIGFVLAPCADYDLGEAGPGSAAGPIIKPLVFGLVATVISRVVLGFLFGEGRDQ
jgi:transcriptional regulator with XRE-family HTH domain